MSLTTARATYVRSCLGPRDDVLDDVLRKSLLEAGMPTIQVDDRAGRVLQMLVTLRRPDHVVEIGTLFGYSTIQLARGLPPGGRLTTFEIDPAVATLARDNLDRAGVGDRVEVVVGDAREHLSKLAAASAGMVFIDGDKQQYDDYLKVAVRVLEPGGVLVVDDAFADGDYTPEGGHDAGDGERVPEVSSTVHAIGRSPRFFSAFIATDTGLLVSVRRDG